MFDAGGQRYCIKLANDFYFYICVCVILNLSRQHTGTKQICSDAKQKEVQINKIC